MEYNRVKLENLAGILSMSKKRRERNLAEDIYHLIYLVGYSQINEEEAKSRLRDINNELYLIFVSKLDAPSKYKVWDYDMTITDRANDLFRATESRWLVTESYAARYHRESLERYGELEYQIPRTSEGYVVTEDLGLTEEQAADAFAFIDKHGFLLDDINGLAQARLDALNGAYGLKHDTEYNRDLCEMILDYKGYPKEVKKVAHI